MLWGFFVFLLLVFYEFLELDRHFMLKLGSDVHEPIVRYCYINPN